MSRSFRKNVIIKDNGTRHKLEEKLYNKRVRVSVRNKMANEDYDNLPLNREHTITDPWDIIDWRHVYSQSESEEKFYKKTKRKQV